MGIREDIIAASLAVFCDGSTNFARDLKGSFNATFSGTGGADVEWTVYQNRRYMLGRSRSTQAALILNKTTQYAIGCWAYCLDTTNTSGEDILVYNGQSGTNGSGLLIRHSSPSYNVSHLLGGRATGPIAATPNATPAHFIAYRGGNNDVRIYRNGVQIATLSNNPNTPTSTAFIIFGAAAKTYVGECFFMNRVPTAAEMTWLGTSTNSLFAPKRGRINAGLINYALAQGGS
jgi:hypothetical protein